MVDFSKYQKKEFSQEDKQFELIPQSPDVKKILIKSTEESEKPQVSGYKDAKIKATVNNLIKILDDIDITQDDLWGWIRNLTRNLMSTPRLPKHIVEPIFREFINKKLKGSEKNGKY